MVDESELIELRLLQLLESETKWWTNEELAATLQLSKATTQKYLNRLKLRLENRAEDVRVAINSGKGGVFIGPLLLTFNSFTVRF